MTDLVAAVNLWRIDISAPLALAVVATLGYLLARKHRTDAGDQAARCRREVHRAQAAVGVNNRRGLDDCLTAQLALMNRYEMEFSVAIFDIDPFTPVADGHGQFQGDRMVQTAARLFDESARETDFIVRHGGEQFVVIMPRTNLEGASVFGERMRARVEAGTPLTVSCGLTAALDGDTSDSLMARADAALDRAKAAGRNCVCRHDGIRIEPVLEEGPLAPGQP